MLRPMQRSVLAVVAALAVQSCTPSLGARLGGALTTQAGGPVTSGVGRVFVATGELPIVALVGTVEVGPSNHTYLAGGEVNIPLARGFARGEYPKAVWLRARFDAGYRTLNDRSGAALGLAGGIAYPFLVVENATRTTAHVFQLAFEGGALSSSSKELTLGPTLEYIFVPQEPSAAPPPEEGALQATRRYW